LIIPSELGYGPRGAGDAIPPNATLCFEVELIDFMATPKATPFNVDGKKAEKTASGLEYIVLESGKGAKAEAGKTVSVHYTGYLSENGKCGKKFDSSVERGEPIDFPLGQGYVIKGWDEGIGLMKVGDKMRLIIPSNLGYGSAGAGGVIPPNATLIFDVELINVK
jgi:peptidylprolyl isomerase